MPRKQSTFTERKTSHSSAPKAGKTGSFFGRGKNNSADSFFTPVSSPAVQPKLTINAPGDKYEQEADAMAEQVVQAESIQCQSTLEEEEMLQSKLLSEAAIQRKCAECEEEGRVQRQAALEEEKLLQSKPLMQVAENGAATATPQLASQLNSSKGSGHPLPKNTLSSMGQAFGADFSGVRVHTGSRAQAMSQGVQARAFTHGADIYFNRGEYNPGATEGKRLLGHELTHVVQQGGNTNQLQRRVIPANVTCNNYGLRNPNLTGPEVVAAIENAVSEAIKLAVRADNLLFLHRVLTQAGDPVDANFDRILQEELDLTLTNPAHFRWIEQAESRFARVRTTLESGYLRFMCREGSCSADTYAFSYPANRLIRLCQRFWDEPHERPQTILHEVFHIWFGMPHTNRLKRANTFCLESFALRLAGQNAPDSCA